MSDETRIITQAPTDRFRVEHDGQRPDAAGCVHPIRHDARLVHEGGREELPFVHLVQMKQDEPCGVRTSGEIAHVGDPQRPVPLDMRHSSQAPVELDLRVRQLEHELRVSTGLQDPMHHALQLKTPLQVRFVNPWVAQSDYRVSVTLGKRRLIDVHIAGQTILSPRPAPPDPCTDPAGARVRPVVDLLGRKDSDHE
jgi:hypothetical protein